MLLPQVQADPADKIKFADSLEDECYRDPNRAVWQLNKQRWLDLYTGNHFADPLVSTGIAVQSLEPEQVNRAKRASEVCKLVYNRVMNAVLAMLAGQVANPPKVVFSARESGEPPIYYLNGFVQNPALTQIAAMAGAADADAQQMAKFFGPDHPDAVGAAAQAGQSVPLPPELVQQVQMLIDQGKMATMQARMAGMPPPRNIVPPEALVEITDQTTAQFTQTIFDALWEQCGGVEATAENVLNKKVLGWQPTLFEYDRTKIEYGDSPITMTNMEGTQVFFDPMTSSFRPPRYVIMKEPVSYEEAVAKYPELDISGALKQKFSEGSLGARSRNGTQTGRLFNIQFARNMAVVRTIWYRDWPYPMDPDEAMTSGKISVQQVPDGGMEEVPDPATGTTMQRPSMRQTMVSNQTGTQDIIPGHPEWPIVYGIREIRDIEGEIVYDQRCKLCDIPVTNNVNIPIPFSPYGYGEPERLDGLQMAINRVLSDLVTFHRYNAYPPEVCDSSVATTIGGQLRTHRTKPDALIVVPPDVRALLGGDISKVTQYLQIPPMPAEAWKLLEFLVEAIDKEANNTDVQQGAAPAGTSGEWVANLQAAANQVAQVTSKSTESWLKANVKLFVDFITNEMTDQDVMKYTSKYPPAIAAAFRRRQKALYIDISVGIQSGSEAAKQGQTNSLIMAKQAGIQVADPEILSRLNVDPDSQLKQQAEWIQKMRDSGLVEAQAEQAVTSGANNEKKDKGQVNAAQQTPQG
jgi:hypothetical protein